MLRGLGAIILFSCGPSPLFPIHLPHIALLRWRLVAAFFSFVLSAYCHCFSCLHALFRLLFVSFFRPSAHYSISPSSYISRFFSWAFICLCGFSVEISCFLAHGRHFFHAVAYCSVLISLAVFPPACFLLLLVILLWLRFSLVTLRLLSLFRCASLLSCAYCVSLRGGSPLPCFSFTLSSLGCGSLSATAVPITGPPF